MPSNAVTKCHGAECDKRDTCWRYLAPAHSFQAWAGFDLDLKYSLSWTCASYIETISKSEQRRHALTTAARLERIEEDDGC